MTEEDVTNVRWLIEENQRFTYDEIHGQLEIGMSQVKKILQEHIKSEKYLNLYLSRVRSFSIFFQLFICELYT